jgi:hypothetical protein
MKTNYKENLYINLGIVFIRGESVTVLPIYIDASDKREYIIVLSAPRFPTGNLEIFRIRNFLNSF